MSRTRLRQISGYAWMFSVVFLGASFLDLIDHGGLLMIAQMGSSD